MNNFSIFGHRGWTGWTTYRKDNSHIQARNLSENVGCFFGGVAHIYIYMCVCVSILGSVTVKRHPVNSEIMFMSCPPHADKEPEMVKVQIQDVAPGHPEK